MDKSKSKLIGENIRKIRELKGIKQSVIAEKMQLSTNGYGKLERADNHLTIDRLYQISTVLECSVIDIISFSEKRLYLLSQETKVRFQHDNNDTQEPISGNLEYLYRLIESQSRIIEKLMKQQPAP